MYNRCCVCVCVYMCACVCVHECVNSGRHSDTHSTSPCLLTLEGYGLLVVVFMSLSLHLLKEAHGLAHCTT